MYQDALMGYVLQMQAMQAAGRGMPQGQMPQMAYGGFAQPSQQMMGGFAPPQAAGVQTLQQVSLKYTVYDELYK